jgi:salicylate hydroxylase
LGAGVGGLTATIALEQAGFEVCTIERAPQFGEVGAGVQLGPNATRVLIRLGMEEDLRRLGVAPPHIGFLRWQDGKTLATVPTGDVASTFGAPYLTMYRPDLINMLSANVSSAQIKLGVAANSVTESCGKPAVMLSDGTLEVGDLVVGADGIHSSVRAETVGDAAPRFSGMSAYRAKVPREALDFDDVVRSRMGPDRHLVAYPVGAGSAYLGIVAVVPEHESTAESWNHAGLGRRIAQPVARLVPSRARPSRPGPRSRLPLGSLRSRSTCALVDRDHHIDGGRVPPHASVLRSRRRPGDRGRRGAQPGPVGFTEGSRVVAEKV